MVFIKDGHKYKKCSQNEKDSLSGLWSCRRPGLNNIICFAAKFSFIYIRVHSESRLQFDAHMKLYSSDIKTFRRSVWCNNSLSNVLLNDNQSSGSSTWSWEGLTTKQCSFGISRYLYRVCQSFVLGVCLQCLCNRWLFVENLNSGVLS